METTNLKELRGNTALWGRDLPMGKIVAIYDFACYSVIKYCDYCHGVTRFHAYLDDVDLGVFASTLEGALLLAIATKYVESDATHMARAAAKILGLEE